MEVLERFQTKNETIKFTFAKSSIEARDFDKLLRDTSKLVIK